MHAFADHLDRRTTTTPRPTRKSSSRGLFVNSSPEIEEDASMVGFKLPLFHKVLFTSRILNERLATLAAESVKMQYSLRDENIDD